MLSFWDGTFSTALVALTETFGIAAAVSLRAPSMAIALLGSTPLMLGSIGQYVLPAFVDVRHARKPQVLVGVGLQSFFLLFAAFTGFVPVPYAAWAYVAGIALAGVSANVTTAQWASWMGDLVPLAVRGRHSRVAKPALRVREPSVALSAGLLAARYSATNAPWTFFTVVFVVAGLCRATSYQLLKRQYEPPVVPPGKRPDWRVRPSADFRTFCSRMR